MAKEPCVYILASGRRGYIYIGVTSHVPGRLWQHRNDVFDGYAKRRNCKRLVRIETYPTMVEAIAREKQLKNWHRQWKINLIEGDNGEWRDLAVEMGLS
ncbi:putative endonuclease [Altererythrobacter xiamenensis]|uniref:Putative endonuclease n=1 Tax=Altererythrobacter xiamenensis TaxID=1316679 RepID=A0A1Y6FBE7_9SPHN|nr:GIY-YIG nuclease family protein [Altererythrobacter xiamenensis]SMQ69753.1 putative endonuclease [Altererythrobacter xiamenensis]